VKGLAGSGRAVLTLLSLGSSEGFAQEMHCRSNLKLAVAVAIKLSYGMGAAYYVL